MSKPPERISCRDENQRCCNGLLEGFSCTSTCPPQQRLQLGKSLFDGRQVRRVGRQKQQATATSLNGLLDTRSQMNREIIQDHDLPWAQAGCQDLFDVDLKRGAISCAIQHKRWPHAGQRQRGNQGHDGSVIARHFADGTLSSGGIGIQRGHGDMGTGLVDKDQILAQQVSGLLAPGGPFGFLLLACSYGLFFRVQPRACLARVILAGLTLRPCAACHSWQCCSRLASGWALNCSNSPACKAAPLMLGRPGMALGKIWPLSRRCLRYRLIVAVEMANVSATSAWFFPWSMARSTRCRKSWEYAFMPPFYHRSILLYTALKSTSTRYLCMLNIL